MPSAVLLNGARNTGDGADAITAALSHMLSDQGWTVWPFQLRDIPIKPCTGCFGCWMHSPGICVIDDPARKIAHALVQADLAAFITPVTFGGYSSVLKKVLDRSIGVISPFFTKIHGEVHHKTRYAHYPNLVVLGSLENPDDEASDIFTTLARRNALNLHSPATAVKTLTPPWNSASLSQTIQTALDDAGVRI